MKKDLTLRSLINVTLTNDKKQSNSSCMTPIDALIYLAVDMPFICPAIQSLLQEITREVAPENLQGVKKYLPLCIETSGANSPTRHKYLAAARKRMYAETKNPEWNKFEEVLTGLIYA